MKPAYLRGFGLLILFFFTGCDRQQSETPTKQPRPVMVETLTRSTPPNQNTVTASAAAWKKESIGFEVGGRVEFVVEPNMPILGRTFDKDGTLITPGTPVARLENERYRLRVVKAKADIRKAEQDLIAGKIKLTRSIPAEITSATATLAVSETEFKRKKNLFEKKAGSQSSLDSAEADFKSATAELDRLEASLRSQEADVASLEAALLQARQDLRDAERDLDDCVLYASFSGDVTESLVVPGSIVSAGESVATLQVMNPIKVEMEVSADISRQLQRGDLLPVIMTMPDGSKRMDEGYLYLIDQVADPETRTFTVTLVVFNERVTSAKIDYENDAVTDSQWGLQLPFLPGAKDGMLFVDEKAILKDDQGFYLWQITNFSELKPRRSEDTEPFKVKKLRIKLEKLKLPYLGGNWIFQQISTDDPDFDPKVNIVVGELFVKTGKPEQWEGDTVHPDESMWMLRPGDLVTVNLAQKSEPGYYVPMASIVNKDGEQYIFQVVKEDGQTIARRKKINVILNSKVISELRQITPLEGETLDELMYITKGVHYLIDGEAINVVSDDQN